MSTLHPCSVHVIPPPPVCYRLGTTPRGNLSVLGQGYTRSPLCSCLVLSWPPWAVTFRGFLHRLQKSETQLWLCCVICQLQICIGIQPGISINIFMWVSADVIGIWAPQIVRGDGGVIQPTSRGFRWVNQGVCHNFGAHEVSSLFSKLSYSRLHCLYCLVCLWI